MSMERRRGGVLGWVLVLLGLTVPASPLLAQGSLSNGGNHVGAISSAGETDTWTFSATAGSTIVLSVGEIGGDSDLWPWIRLIAPNSSQIGNAYNAVVAQIDVTAPLTGTYTVIVGTADAGNDAVGDYRLTLALVPGTPSDGDDAGPVTNGANHQASLHEGDLDQWTFSATGGASLVLSVGEVGGDSAVWPWIRLFGPNGTLVGQAYNAVVAQVHVTAPLTGTYTAVVSSADAGYDAAGVYRLTLAMVPGATPVIPSGDEGGAVTNGANHQGHLHEGDLDQWTFSTAGGASIVLSVGEVGGDSAVWPWIRLFGPNGALVAQAYNAIVAQVDVTAPLTGTYTAVVSSADAGYDAVGDYQLTLAVVPGSEPVVPTGDQGGTLTNGLNHPGVLHVGDLDQWRFTAAAGASVIVSVGEVGGDSAVWPWIRLFGPNGALVAQAYNAVVAQVDVTAPLTGIYTVVVSSADAGYDAADDYRITLALVPGTPEVPTGDEGGPVTNGANHGGILHEGDLDQWTFTAPAGASIVLSVGEVGGDSAVWPWIRLFGPNGALVAQAYNAIVAQVEVTAAVTGTYTAVVSSADAGYDAAGDYLLTLALVPGTPIVPTGDQGGPMTNAFNHQGDLHVGDLDQWRFYAPAGGTLALSVAEIGGDSALWPWMRLYGPNGALVRSAYSAEVAQVNLTAPQAGLYTIVVSSADAGYDAEGDYQISVVGAIPDPGDPVDLRLTKTVSAPAIERGGPLTYTLTVTNLGATAAVGVAIADAVPSALTITACTATGGAACTASGNTRTVSYASLGPGASQTVTIATTVGVAAGATITNTATVASTTLDANPANNSAQATTSVSGTPTSTDVDGDGLPNPWETQFGLNPDSGYGSEGRDGDPDGDSLTNGQELQGGTHPRGFFRRYLAEGAMNAFFDVRLALLNVGATPARLLRRYLQDGAPPLVQFEVLPPGTRRTLTRDDLVNLTSPAFSTVVESDQPIVFDRTMTWGGGYGSHAESGLPDPATTWYLAEGSTTWLFSLFYLLQNPNATATTATVRYLLPGGQPPIVRQYPLAPNSRTTIAVDDQGPVLASTDVSAEITAPLPIIVERAMYRSTPTQTFAAGHGSAGVTALATRWFLAEGATGPFFDCFILLANPGSQPANVTIEYLLSDGTTQTKAYTVPASGRSTIWVDNEEIPAGSGRRPLDNVAVSSLVTSDVPIIVERTMWWPGPAITSDYWIEAHNSPGTTATGTAWAMAEGEVGGPDHTETYILIANTSTTPGTARVTLYFEDGTNVSRDIPLLPRSRRTLSASADFAALVDFSQAGRRRFGSTVESLGSPAAQIVVERAMYTSPGGVTWAAGTNALAARLQR